MPTRRRSLKSIHRNPPIPVIYKCPIEIFDEIFSVACTDGGATGRSLSAVSKRICEVSKGFKYHTLVVQQHQLRSLAVVLRSLPLSARRVVRLAIHSESSTPLEDRFFDTDKNRVLALVAHSLCILEVVANRAQFLLPITLPSLRDLTLHGEVTTEKLTKRNMACYPALKHFHLKDAYIEGERIPLFPPITRVAPTLEVFKLSPSERFYGILPAIKDFLQKSPSLKIVLCSTYMNYSAINAFAKSHKQITVEESQVFNLYGINGRYSCNGE